MRNPLSQNPLSRQPAQQPAKPLMKFNRVTVRDPMVNNIEGATLLVPEGWKVEGGFVWTPLYSMQANLLLRVSDPATGTSVDTLPSLQFAYPLQNQDLMQVGQNWNGSTVLPPPRDPVQLVQAVYMPQSLAHLRQARLVGTQDLPQLAAEVKRTSGQAAVHCTKLRYAYELGGRQWEEDVYVTLALAAPNQYVSMWYCTGNALRAPAGQLDRLTPLLTVPLQSTKLSLDWFAVLEQCRHLFRNNVRQQMADTQRLGEMWRQHREQMRQQWQQVYQERQQSQERQNFAFRELLGGIETYKDPYEHRNIELPAGYQDYWVNNQGQYVLSNDPTYNPNTGNTREWKRMERYRP